MLHPFHHTIAHTHCLALMHAHAKHTSKCVHKYRHIHAGTFVTLSSIPAAWTVWPKFPYGFAKAWPSYHTFKVYHSSVSSSLRHLTLMNKCHRSLCGLHSLLIFLLLLKTHGWPSLLLIELISSWYHVLGFK